MHARDNTNKLMVLVFMLLVYLIIGTSLLVMVNTGVIKRTPYLVIEADNSTDTDPVVPRPSTSESLTTALSYLQLHLKKPNGHIDLYEPLHKQEISQHNHTNSEAASYYLQIMAQQGDKAEFDKQLAFIRQYMMHPEGNYLMWRLDDADMAIGEGRNIAPDADLRALHSLYVAKDLWGDPSYDLMIDRIAKGLETVAINNDNVLVAYGGMSGEKPWRADVSYLAYSDFQVYDRLANTRVGVWPAVATKMRNITLGAQIWNGLYNSEYYPDGKYGNGIDGGKYSINSLWIMVRFAESDDPALIASAKRSLAFYQEEYAKNGRVFDAYNSDGTPATLSESPWNYALIARAASALHEDSFAQLMERRMLDFQILNKNSARYGAIVEGAENDERVGQFTMQESILAMQQIEGKAVRFTD